MLNKTMRGACTAGMLMLLLFFAIFGLLPAPEHLGYRSIIHLYPDKFGDGDLSSVILLGVLLLIPLGLLAYARERVFVSKGGDSHGKSH